MVVDVVVVVVVVVVGVEILWLVGVVVDRVVDLLGLDILCLATGPAPGPELELPNQKFQ